ncbi:hypothetical protein Gekk315_00032 [Aeromonas phage Gekk3-15]
MTDNDMIRIVRERIMAALAAKGWSDIVVQQKAQPEQQGTPIGRAVFILAAANKRYGFAGRKIEYNQAGDVFDETETQIIEVSFEISALARQGTDINKPTAKDILNYLAMFMSSRQNVRELLKSNLNILRITEVRNGSFGDDQERFAFHPSFDLIIVSDNTITGTVPVVKRLNGDALGV